MSAYIGFQGIRHKSLQEVLKCIEIIMAAELYIFYAEALSQAWTLSALTGVQGTTQQVYLWTISRDMASYAPPIAPRFSKNEQKHLEIRKKAI